MKTLIKLWKDDSGASAAEYALILAIVGTLIAGAAITLGGSIRDAMTSAAACIDDGATCATAAS
jgi:pilus assembly protein Flp/PilA